MTNFSKLDGADDLIKLNSCIKCSLRHVLVLSHKAHQKHFHFVPAVCPCCLATLYLSLLSTYPSPASVSFSWKSWWCWKKVFQEGLYHCQYGFLRLPKVMILRKPEGGTKISRNFLFLQRNGNTDAKYL